MNSKHRFILVNLLAFEFVLFNAVLSLFIYFILPEDKLNHSLFFQHYLTLVIIYNLSWLFITLFIRNTEFYFSPNYGYIKNFLISLFFFIGLVTTLVILSRLTFFKRSTYILPIFIFSFMNFLSHKYLLSYLKKRGAHLFSDALLIGSGLKIKKLNELIHLMADHGYNIRGYLQDQDRIFNPNLDVRLMGRTAELQYILLNHHIDEIFIDMAAMDHSQMKDVIQIADSFGVRVKLIPENPSFFAKNYMPVTLGEMAVFKYRRSPLDSFSTTILKRLFDFCFALIVIILLSPVFLIIGVLIRLDSKGPVLYNPYRKGEGGETFKCYKFRTMSVCDNPVNGTKSTIVNDPRITRVGKLLRKSDLDELPQFFNVLRGEMSVIGPRPHRTNLQDDFRRSVADYMVRCYVKPGITGWAQVNGWRGPTNTDEEKYERVNHDLWYIENWSFWLDVKIIFLTVFGGHRKKAF